MTSIDQDRLASVSAIAKGSHWEAAARCLERMCAVTEVRS